MICKIKNIILVIEFSLEKYQKYLYFINDEV
jgi:hypothetical protein